MDFFRLLRITKTNIILVICKRRESSKNILSKFLLDLSKTSNKLEDDLPVSKSFRSKKDDLLFLHHLILSFFENLKFNNYRI